MKVEIRISPNIEEAYAVIYTNTITGEIQKLASAIESYNSNTIITAKDGDRIVVLRPKEIFMAIEKYEGIPQNAQNVQNLSCTS